MEVELLTTERDSNLSIKETREKEKDEGWPLKLRGKRKPETNLSTSSTHIIKRKKGTSQTREKSNTNFIGVNNTRLSNKLAVVSTAKPVSFNKTYIAFNFPSVDLKNYRKLKSKSFMT